MQILEFNIYHLVYWNRMKRDSGVGGSVKAMVNLHINEARKLASSRDVL